MAQACVYSCQQYLLCCWLRWIRWILLSLGNVSRVVNGWNSLPTTVVNAETVDALENAFSRNYVKDMDTEDDEWWARQNINLQVSTFKFKTQVFLMATYLLWLISPSCLLCCCLHRVVWKHKLFYHEWFVWNLIVVCNSCCMLFMWYAKVDWRLTN